MPRHNAENSLSTGKSNSDISDNERSSGSETDDDDNLKDIRAAIAPRPVTSTPQETPTGTRDCSESPNGSACEVSKHVKADIGAGRPFQLAI
ncbi:hypothetical protein PAXRUDRAFT_18995 [Paxillus rubicundulus Ve08.2h10]|uniref:Uncharacterized protein n=1 Tax=Paxillus rubicundulus Ve08.2h10 TaxID=930991 RepID=A0A0D0CJW9_9AGAM|nr:hypothetical protein PAXRUDRAFT_18995 [Paxillus rubicundulus Ve08.2h10]